MARNHIIKVSNSGLITICGGKWTTYRRMAEEVIDRAIQETKLKKRPCKTHDLRLHGYKKRTHYTTDPWNMHGTDADQINLMIEEHPEWGKELHPRLPYLAAEVIWAVRQEMALTLEDVLSRRTRALFLDVKAAIEMAPKVAHLMARELGKNEEWEKQQLLELRKLTEISTKTES